MAAFGQVSGNQSLNGKYSFRQVLLVTDSTANVTDTRTGAGTITFDGNGHYTVTGQVLIGTVAPAALSVTNGTYTVKPGGFTTLSNPIRSGATVNARLGVGALVGSSTEAGGGVFDLFVAIPAPAQPVSNSTLNGAYWISSLEFPNGGVANIRDTNFKLTANGSGSFTETTVTGQAANLGNKLQSQTVGPMTYSVSPDGTGTLTFPTASGLDATTQLIAGGKSVFVSGDGSYLIGGSTTAGGHGLIVGLKALSGSVPSANGFYFTAGMRYDTQPARLASVVGGVNLTSLGGIWARRTRQSDGLFDASVLTPITLGADGSSTLGTGGHGDFNGVAFTTSGVDITDALSYEIYFGARLPAQSGTGVFLNPQGVLNSASFAPPGYPISPGGFVSLYGTGFGTQNFTATSFPFPTTTTTGVQVSINGIAAPIYSVSAAAPAQISAITPYGVTGSVATIVVTVNGTKSNSVDVPLAASAPGIFSIAQNGIGDAAIRHLDGTVVSAANPAKRGEFVSVYLAGLGPVDHPPVPDGAAAPGKEPLARIVGPVNVYIGGQLVNTPQFAGLTPTLAGLYQLNIQIPLTLASGSQDLAVQTVEGFTDMVNIAIN